MSDPTMIKRQMAEKAAEILGETRNVYMDEDRARELAERIVDELYDSFREAAMSDHARPEPAQQKNDK